MITNDILRKFVGSYIRFFATSRPCSMEDFNEWYKHASSEWLCITKNMDSSSLNSPIVKAISDLFDKAETIFYEVAISSRYSPITSGWPEIKELASSILRQ